MENGLNTRLKELPDPLYKSAFLWKKRGIWAAFFIFDDAFARFNICLLGF
jgi:hypothetical protein